MGSSLACSRKPAGNSNRHAEGFHERGKAVLQLLAAYPDLFGQSAVDLNGLEKHSCLRVSGRNAGICCFQRKNHSALCIDSQREAGAGLALALLANRGATENVVELYHSPHGIVLTAQWTQSLILQSNRRDGRCGGKDRFDQIYLVSRFIPLLA